MRTESLVPRKRKVNARCPSALDGKALCTSVDFFTLEKGDACRGPGPGSQKKRALLNLRDAQEGPLELGFVLGGERE